MVEILEPAKMSVFFYGNLLKMGEFEKNRAFSVITPSGGVFGTDFAFYVLRLRFH